MSNAIFSERLLFLRKRAHLTQQEVANALNLHRTSYTKYETGVVTPDHQGLVALADLFGVSVDYLIGREASPDAPIITDADGELMRLSLQEKLLVQTFRQLDYDERQKLVQQAQLSCKKKDRNK